MIKQNSCAGAVDGWSSFQKIEGFSFSLQCQLCKFKTISIQKWFRDLLLSFDQVLRFFFIFLPEASPHFSVFCKQDP